MVTEQKKSYLVDFWTQVLSLDSESQLLNVLKNIPAEKLFSSLRSRRGRGRNDYPISEAWETLYRRLLLAPNKQKNRFSESAFSRFLSQIKVNQELIIDMTHQQIKTFYLKTPLPKAPLILGYFDDDKRGLRYSFLVESCFGIPIAVNLEKKSSDLFSVAYSLIEEFRQLFPFSGEQILIANENYDDVSFITKLWDEYHFKPIIPFKTTPEISYTAPFPEKNILVSSLGEVFCISSSNEKKQMVYCGFEKKRGTLKFKCISRCYQVDCKNQSRCAAFLGVRIPLELDRKIFTPIPRSSYKIKLLYQRISSVQLFCSYLGSFKEKIRTCDLEKKRVFYLLLRSILYAIALEIPQKEKKPSAKK